MNDDLFAVVAILAAIWCAGKVMKTTTEDRPKKPRRVTVNETPAKFIPYINLHNHPEMFQ